MALGTSVKCVADYLNEAELLQVHEGGSILCGPVEKEKSST